MVTFVNTDFNLIGKVIIILMEVALNTGDNG